VKIGETGPNRLYQFFINQTVNLNFLKILNFLKKMVYQFRYRFFSNTDWKTGITDWFIGFDGFQPLPTDRFIGFSTGLPVIPIGKPIIPTGLPILDFLNAKFEFGTVFNRFYRFSWEPVISVIFKTISVFHP
jgi:hypothetical protein